MKTSIYDIAYLYINKYYTEISEDEVRVIIRSIRRTLANGATDIQIYNKINEFDKIDKTDSEFFSKIRPDGNKNLLDQSRFYYHNELRITPPPPIRKIDFLEDEVFIESEDIKEEFYLEMRCSYTVEDLYNFLCTRKSFIKVIGNKSKCIGGIIFLLKKYDIESILFMIDVSDSINSDKKRFARNILDIDEFENSATEKLNSCKTAAFLSQEKEGNTKIKKKSRNLEILKVPV